MGVKQTTDVLERGTWIFAGVVALLCLFSVVFISGSATSSGESRDAKEATVPATTTPGQNNNTTPFNANPPATNPPK